MVQILPFIYSTLGKPKLESEIAAARRVSNGFAERLITGAFNSIDRSTFALLESKTIVVVGHVVQRDGEPFFEMKTADGALRYLSFAAMDRAQKELRFNWFPLGCGTAESGATGTTKTINDLHALDAFIRATSKAGTTGFGSFVTDLSGPDIQIAFDLTRLDKIDVVPIELLDRNREPYRVVIEPTAEFRV